MNIFVVFMLKSIIASGILFLYYLAALKNKKFHSYNRFYLVLSVAVSLVVPFINIPLFSFETSPVSPPAAAFSNLANRIGSPPETSGGELSRFGTLLLIIAALISFSLLIALFLKIRWVYQMKKTYKNTKREGFTFIETDLRQAPFSFLSYLFWRQGLSLTEPNGENIFKHELAHITQRHTYDKLFMQIVSCSIWVNPFYRLLQRELDTIHEFIADAACIADGETESFAKMLLYAHHEGRHLSPSHPFFNSSVKRRLAMINSSKKASFSYVRRLLAIPVVLLAVVVIATRANARSNAPKPSPALSSATDYVPKAKDLKLKPITVIGYKGRSTPPPSSNTSSSNSFAMDYVPKAKDLELKPITVIGYKGMSTPPLYKVVRGMPPPSSNISSSNSAPSNNNPGPTDKVIIVKTVQGYKATTPAKTE